MSPAKPGTGHAERHRVGGYRAFGAPARLAGAAAGLWIHHTAARETQHHHRVLPDPGTSLVLYGAREPSGRLQEAVLCLHGPILTPRRFELIPGRELAAVALYPEWLPGLLGTASYEHLDGIVALNDIAPRSVARWMSELLATATPHDALRTLARIVAQRLETARPPPANLARALSRLRACRGDLRMTTLATSIGWSERQLRRAFQDTLRTTPKRLARQLRFLALMEAADRSERPDWADLAVQFGYFDQSHLAADARRLVGASPGFLHAERRAQY